MPKRDVAAGLALLTDAGLEPAVLDLDVFSLADAAVSGRRRPAGENRRSSRRWGTRPPDPCCTTAPRVFARSLAQGASAANGRPADPERLAGPLRHTLLACEDTLQQACEPDLLLVAGGEPEAPASLAAALEAATGIASRAWRHQAPGGRAGRCRRRSGPRRP